MNPASLQVNILARFQPVSLCEQDLFDLRRQSAVVQALLDARPFENAHAPETREPAGISS